MSTESVTLTDDREPPKTPSELRETPIRPGDLLVPLTDDRWFFALRRSPTPACAFEVSEGGTLDETAGCEPDDDVVVAVDLEEAQDTAGVDDAEDIPEAVADGRLAEIALPSSSVVVAVEEFVEVKARGEWSGVVAYLREASD